MRLEHADATRRERAQSAPEPGTRRESASTVASHDSIVSGLDLGPAPTQTLSTLRAARKKNREEYEQFLRTLRR
jgi:hypothetical protein